jgi:cytochrome c oxidase subunit 3/cytochrome o ubiquinol oxidase subunit 3
VQQAAEVAGHEVHDTSTGLDNTKLALWAFLSSEALLFGALISSYLLYRTRGAHGPYPHEVYDIPFTSVSSFVLLMSSLTMVLALAAIQRGNQRGTRVWLMATALLGMTFLAGQTYEFTSFVREGFTVTTNPGASAFFLLTSTHGVHVSIGVLMLLSLFSMAMRGQLPTEKARVVELVGLYWHFVDIVWIIIFTVVYLIPAPTPAG